MSGLRSRRVLLTFVALPALVAAGATACQPVAPPPHNDNFTAPTVLAGTAQGLAQGTTTGATLQKGESPALGPASVWFRWTAPQSGAASFTTVSGLPVAVEAYTGTTWGHLVRAGDDNGGSTQFRTTPGTAYSIRITGLAGGAFTLKWNTSAPPVNDARAAADALVGSTGSVLDDATAATVEPNDPKIDGVPVPATVWYRWTAPADGWYEFDTHGSQVSTGLGVYTDTSPAQLVDDSAGECTGLSSLIMPSAAVKFQATRGTSYLLMIGGSDADEPSAASLGGPIQLNWRPAANAPVAAGNDTFASAAALTGASGMVSGSTEGATVEPNEPAVGGLPARNSVWFSWTPPASGTYQLSTFAGLTDGCPAALAIYTGSSLAALHAVPNALDGLGPFQTLPRDSGSGIAVFGGGAELRVTLTAGTTYRIAVDRLSQPGPFTLTWDMPQAAPVIRSATPGNGSIGVIWSAPPRTAGSPLSGYIVMAIPMNDDLATAEPLTLPANATFATIHGLHNGTAYQVFVAAFNDSGPGDPAIAGPVTPKA
jgi:hypothetical protein